MRTCSPAAGMSAVNCSPARGNGKTGSSSENATSAGLSQLRQAVAHGAHLGGADVVVGAGPATGTLCAPALLSGVGKGAS